MKTDNFLKLNFNGVIVIFDFEGGDEIANYKLTPNGCEGIYLKYS